MGGWPLTAALKEHLRAGFRVYATPPAALTVHDDLRVVQGLGVVLTEDPPRDAEVIVCQDLDVERRSSALELYGVPLPRRVAVAVQDHGQSIGVSNRDTRGRHWRGFIEGGGHGCFYHPAYRADGGFRFVTLIGPNRRIADGAGYYQAAPYGDVMLAGCFGLLAAAGALTVPSL